jgi:DNA ligase-associated metallophosphoesterase
VADRAWSGSASFEACSLGLAASELVADRSGALYLPGERTLIVADLHLEKGSSFAARGRLLPPYDTRETLGRLANVVDRYAPRRVVALGDSLHDMEGAGRLGTEELAALKRLQAGRDWLWLTGNHDPEIAPSVGGEVASSLALGALVLKHEPSPGEFEGEIAGHLHPVARFVVGGVGQRLRCFIGDGRRLVLPAFGAFTGGLNVLDAAFQPLFTEAAVQVLGRNGIYPVAWAALGPD